VLPRRAEHCPLEVVADERPAGFEQVVERLQQPAFGGLRLAPFGLDSLAHIPVEQVDGLARGEALRNIVTAGY